MLSTISSALRSTTMRMSMVAVASPGMMNGMVPVSAPRKPLRRPAMLKVGP